MKWISGTFCSVNLTGHFRNRWVCNEENCRNSSQAAQKLYTWVETIQVISWRGLNTTSTHNAAALLQPQMESDRKQGCCDMYLSEKQIQNLQVTGKCRTASPLIGGTFIFFNQPLIIHNLDLHEQGEKLCRLTEDFFLPSLPLEM